MKKNTEFVSRNIKTLTQLRVSRRNFIKNALVLGTVTSASGLVLSCNFTPTSINLSKKKEKILISIQNILFPKDETSPGAYDILAHEYVKWWLTDIRIEASEQQYVVNGLKWVDDTAQENHQKNYVSLTKQEQVNLVYNIANEPWGDNWLSVMLTFIFEAMISDPIYGYNKNEIGWDWINHVAGLPKPTENLKYDTIFKTLKHNTTNG